MADADIFLKFGVYTADRPTDVIKQFRPVLNIIESAIGEKLGERVKIKLQVAKSYEKGIRDLVEGKVDFSRFGPASYIEAKQTSPKISTLAVESNKGKMQ